RTHQGARQGGRDPGDSRQRRRAGGDRHRAAPADGALHGGHARGEDPDGTRRQAGGGRRARRLAVLRRVLVLDGRGVRPLGRPGDLLTWGAPRWPPTPPNVRSAPAKPWRSSKPPTFGTPRQKPWRSSKPPTLGTP